MNRRGISLLEVAVASVLLLAVMGLCLQLLQLTAGRHRATEMRQLAIREADNVMQRVTAVAWDELTPQAARQTHLSQEAGRRLTDGTLQVEIDASPDNPNAKRIVVRIEWQDRTGRPVRPVKLVAWRYRNGPSKREDPT